MQRIRGPHVPKWRDCGSCNAKMFLLGTDRGYRCLTCEPNLQVIFPTKAESSKSDNTKCLWCKGLTKEGRELHTSCTSQYMLARSMA